MHDLRTTQLRRLLAEARVPRDVCVFVFGSFARADNTPNDVDVLVVYDRPDAVDLTEFVATLRVATISAIPVDVFVLSRAEERELDFIRAQGAVQVVPGDDRGAPPQE